jgi:hypothetical protein
VSWIIHSLPASLFVDKASNATDAMTAADDKATDSVNPATDVTSTASVMANHTWRELKVFQEEEDNIIRHLCNPGRSADPPTKPTKGVLYSLLQKYLVTSGRINIKKMEDGKPVYEPGVTEKAEASSSQTSSQSLQASSLQAALANLTSSQLNSAQLKALRKEQEQAQAVAREKKTRDDKEKEQKHLADGQVRHKAYIAKNDELPPCPLCCRGKECTVECTTDVMYRHDMVDCENPAHANASATAIGNCRMWHKRAPKKRAPKNSGGGPRARGTPPRAKQRDARVQQHKQPQRRRRRQRLQRHCMQTWSRGNHRRSSCSSLSSSLSSSSGSSSSISDPQCLLPFRVFSHRRAKTRSWQLY